MLISIKYLYIIIKYNDLIRNEIQTYFSEEEMEWLASRDLWRYGQVVGGEFLAVAALLFLGFFLFGLLDCAMCWPGCIGPFGLWASIFLHL